MPEVAELSRELAAHVLDPDPGRDAAALLECGFGDDRWFECLVADADTGIVGFAMYSRMFEAHTREKRLWLSDLCVTQSARRQGAGRLLMSAVLERAAESGCAGVDLVLARGNELGRTFYVSLGAQVSDEVKLVRLSFPAGR